MRLDGAVASLGQVDVLDRLAAPAAKAIKRIIGPGPVKDLASGTWLGHPVHPPLTDLPIGLCASATLLDLLGGERGQDARDTLVVLGVIAAVPTVASGAADWSDSYGEDLRVGLVHALANSVGLALYAISLAPRRRGDRRRGTMLGLAGMTSMAVGGYLGGHLSYSRGMGVNHAFLEDPPGDWTAVIADAELPEHQPVRVVAGDAAVLLYRTPHDIFAIGSRCSHAGGPLEEGTVDDAECTVQCPWHQSVFRLGDGSVVHGPASTPQVAYDARVHDAHVEIRQRR